MHTTPILHDSTGRRTFACHPAAVLAFIVGPDERILMLSHPARRGWEVINGALDGAESVLQGVLRETREEAGDQVRVRPLGALHAYTFRYDDAVQHMISIAYLLAYEGGEVIPGDDMRGSAVRWVSVDEIERGAVSIEVPTGQPWLFRRAIDLYRLLRDQPPVTLQPAFDESTRNKYTR